MNISLDLLDNKNVK